MIRIDAYITKRLSNMHACKNDVHFFGNGVLNTYPYKLVTERKQVYDLPGKKDEELYSKASKVVCYIEDMALKI